MGFVDSTSNNSNVIAFLKTIQKSEGTYGSNAYNFKDGGKTFDSTYGWDYPIGAQYAGAYMLTQTTWDVIKNYYKLKDFSPKNQDYAAITMIMDSNAVDDVINGDFDLAIAKCNKKWKTLPDSPLKSNAPKSSLTILRNFYVSIGGTLKKVPSASGSSSNNTTINNSDTSTDNAPPVQDLKANANKSSTDSNNTNNLNVGNGIVHIFDATLKPAAIEFEIPNSDEFKEAMKEGIGYMPFVWYNAYQILETDISYLLLYNDGIAPCIKIIFRDSFNMMRDKGFPLDDTKITLFLNPKSGRLKPIFLQFKLTNLAINDAKYILAGTLDADTLYVSKYQSFPSMSSLDALQAISKQIGLGFNTNISSTNDTMTWLNTNGTVYDLINNDILENSYISDNSFLMGYIDYYYNFNYIDVEKELNRDIDEELGITDIGMEDILDIKDNDRIGQSLLTNDASMENSNSYISDYTIINNSTDISIQEGYKNVVKYYDEIAKSFLIFEMDSITSDGSETIILKGAPQDNAFYTINSTEKYVGLMDTDNVHKNYNYANVQNDKNLTDLGKIGLVVTMGIPNYNLYRFQKMKVVITNSSATPSQTMFNNRLSGNWLITDIKLRYSEGVLSQLVTLIKRELELSTEELSVEEFKTNRDYKNTSRSYSNNGNSANLNDIESSDPTYIPPANVTDDDINWLVTCILDEARGESDDGRAAVAQVIINRKNSGHSIGISGEPLAWRGTMKAVILARKQFSGFWDGANSFQDAERIGFQKMGNYMKLTQWVQAKELLLKVVNGTYTGSAQYQIIKKQGLVLYLNPRTAGSVALSTWAIPSKLKAIVGNHNFYSGK